MDRLIPFSPDVYVNLFERYNDDLWPMQIVTLAMGLMLIALSRRGGDMARMLSAATLAAFWIWTGWDFQIDHYAALNWAALPFGALFIVQGIGLMLAGALSDRLNPALNPAGIALICAAALAHPLLVLVTGSPLGQAHAFGLTPMPTVLATLGWLALARGGVPWGLLVLPLLFSAWEGLMAWEMGLPRDLLLPLLGVIAGTWLFAAGFRRP